MSDDDPRADAAAARARDEEPLDRVFVYGSLRCGQRFRYLIAPYIVKERPAHIRGDMYHFAPPGETGPYPYVVAGEGRVRGDVLWLRDLERALEVLDELEEHPRVYVRRAVRVTYDDATTERAFVYFLATRPAGHGRAVPGGDWVAERG